MEKTIDVVCAGCGKTFQKDFVEYRRRSYKKKKMYCSLTCYGNSTAKNNIPPGMGQKYKHNLMPSARLDYFSPFRYYQRQIKRNTPKYGSTDLTLFDLGDMWENQDGICPYTGFKMILPRTTQDRHSSPYCASLDRIDPSKGYVKGNVEFICLFINYAKNTFTKEQTLQFIQKLVESGASSPVLINTSTASTSLASFQV